MVKGPVSPVGVRVMVALVVDQPTGLPDIVVEGAPAEMLNVAVWAASVFPATSADQ